MRSFRIHWFSFALLLFLAPAFADNASGDLDFGSCATPRSESHVRECLGEAKSAVDSRLKKLRSMYRKEETQLGVLLKKSQERWADYIATECKVRMYFSKGRSGYETIVNACLASAYRDRAKTLQWMIDNPRVTMPPPM